MKKKDVKEIILKSIVGFPVGPLVLMISYVCIYFIAGQAVFENEINQLKDVKILIAQILASGMAWLVIFIEFNLVNKFEEKYGYNNIKKAEKEYDYNNIKKAVIGQITSTVISIGVFFGLNQMPIFSENLADMSTIIFVIIFALAGLVKLIIESIDKLLINKKIKEINREQYFEENT